MRETVNSLWIEGDLGLVQLLTIKSFLAHDYNFVLWTYEKPKGVIECEIRDAREIVPEEEIFFYKHLKPEYKYGGIAERLKAELLFRFGGWHVDLDVTCLKDLGFRKVDYIFRPHSYKGAVAWIIKAPAGSDLARKYRDWTLQIDEENKDFTKSFEGLFKAIQRLGLTACIVDSLTFGLHDLEEGNELLLNNGKQPNSEQRAVHWALATRPLHWKLGSFFDSLLTKYKVHEAVQKRNVIPHL